ncbi:carbohydrate ABC transporter permease [Pseudalkalibacillus caeni]|uniref:Carbohydrate ABC transporter permease n=1 Tax=Exobacillus caeni TaxID=2574798 RepID=A0A5R9F7K6_9BACL|nr:carbohydrate ABC transporter permease [Pseudalkalibacillus caeni]TLS39011.1 carbohydrate ABC transporter permease [Pseudalkalibacillus caeni]
MEGIRKNKFHESQTFRRRFMKTIIMLILLVGSVVILSPVWWLVSTSLKSMQEIMQFPPSFMPESFRWQNYVEAWNTAPFTRWTLNTLFVTTCVVIGNVLVNSFVAYGFAKVKFPYRNLLFTIVLSTMLIPGFVVMIPQYMLFAELGWVNTYLPLIVPAFFGSAFFIFLLRQFFMTIPNELIDAAKIDGANHFVIWWKIVLPLTKPAIATVAIFSFNGAWNDFLGPLLYLNDESLYTLQIGLQTFKGTVSTQWHYLMAASVMVLLPVILLFFIFQRYFIEGANITGGGTKG